MPHSVVSDLGLHCMLMSHKKDSRLTWVNTMSSIGKDEFLSVTPLCKSEFLLSKSL